MAYLYDYCYTCGKRIEIGDKCYTGTIVGGGEEGDMDISICMKCLKIVDTEKEFAYLLEGKKHD